MGQCSCPSRMARAMAVVRTRFHVAVPVLLVAIGSGGLPPGDVLSEPCGDPVAASDDQCTAFELHVCCGPSNRDGLIAVKENVDHRFTMLSGSSARCPSM